MGVRVADLNPREYVNLRAILAGISLVAAFVLITQYMSDNVEPASSIGPFKRILGVLFVGLSTGYYVGKSIGKEGGPIDSFLIGFFGSLAFIVLFVTELSVLSGILIFVAATAFLMYNSGLVASNEEIETWINTLTSISLYGLVVLAFIHYGVPVLFEALIELAQFFYENPLWLVGSGIVLLVLAVAAYRFVDLERVQTELSDFVYRRLRRF